MTADIVSFVLRLYFIVVFWAFVWKLVRPRTQLMRILRAALLVVVFLGILALSRVAGM